MDATIFTVANGRIYVQPQNHLHDRCKAVPGAIWNHGRLAWEYPARPQVAKAIFQQFKGTGAAKVAAEFRELLQMPDLPPEDDEEHTGPDPLTALWQHQHDALNFVLHKHGAMLAHDMGCVDGDAVVTVNRAGKSFKITMAELHYKFNGGETRHGHRPNRIERWREHIPTRVRSLKADGTIGLAAIVATYDRGIQPTLLIATERGKQIAVTPDHEMVTPGGKVRADALAAGDTVLTNGRYIDKDGYARLWGTGHPREGTGGIYEHIIVAERTIGRRLMPGEVVHHKNGEKSDNRPDNLAVMLEADHLRLHVNVLSLDKGDGKFIPIEDRIVSIEEGGDRHVYDLTVDEPAHTFIANGVVVGNSGKTLTAIAAILKRRHDKTLIICPARVVEQWAEQIERHAGDMIHALPLRKGTLAKRVEQAAFAVGPQGFRPLAIIINYEALASDVWKRFMLKQQWDCVILDESHRIKAPGGVWSRAVAALRSRAAYRLCLTGTPMPHSPLDVYAQYRFLAPELFGTNHQLFRQTYAEMGGFQGKEVVGYRNLDDLHAKFYAIAHRVETGEVIDLPDYLDIEQKITLGSKAREAYETMAEGFYAMVDEGVVTASNALAQLLRLQQITSGYLPIEDGEPILIDHGKEHALVDLLEDLPPTEPVVVFARFRADLESVARACRRAGRAYGEISGRADDYNAWRAGNVNVIGVQIQAGGEGLNDLVRARYGVYYSLGFSLAQYRQSRARLIRPGQKRNVVYYHLVAENTIDQRVYQALAKREDVIASVLRRETS